MVGGLGGKLVFLPPTVIYSPQEHIQQPRKKDNSCSTHTMTLNNPSELTSFLHFKVSNHINAPQVS